MKKGDVVPAGGLMQTSEKQKSDVATLLSMAKERNLLPDDPTAPEEDEGEQTPLGDDETDPEAEAALGEGPVAKTRPAASQEPGGADRTGVPEGFPVPDDFAVEPGTRVAFLTLKAEHTARPRMGDRQCVLVPLTVKMEQIAYKRAAMLGDSTGVLQARECAKHTIAVIDGRKPDWARPKGTGGLDGFWEHIGPKYRQMITSWYVKTHVLSQAERESFLLSSLDDRTM
jgi:hypothetical protein